MERTSRHARDEDRDAVWSALCERQAPALERSMCADFLAGARALALDPTRMPRHAELSRRLSDLCGWRIETVPGLIPARDFFALLRERRFPSPEWIRHPDELEYTSAPDAFHDLYGHLPQLASPSCTRVLEALADAADGADDAALAEVERVYWFTVEFGLVAERGTLRALGAGLASSIAELERALRSTEVERRPFELAGARATRFRTDRPQELYLVAPPPAALAAELEGFGRRARGRVA
jgi:phenylalanine-4-hydroxylase